MSSNRDGNRHNNFLSVSRKLDSRFQQERRWSRFLLDWLLFWWMRRIERSLQEEFAASEYTEANGDDKDRSSTISFFNVQVAPSIPVQISFKIPFTRNWITVGKESAGRLRKRVQHKPEDAQAHITLAAYLLSEQPLLPEQASEAAKHLRTALKLMPTGEEIGGRVQWKAMAHKFLGDALLVLGERMQAREHWERAIVLDPAPPPHGFSGLAQELLNKYPL